MLLADVWDWSRFLEEFHAHTYVHTSRTYGPKWFLKEVFGSNSMNMLIAMAPNMWH